MRPNDRAAVAVEMGSSSSVAQSARGIFRPSSAAGSGASGLGPLFVGDRGDRVGSKLLVPGLGQVRVLASVDKVVEGCEPYFDIRHGTSPSPLLVCHFEDAAGRREFWRLQERVCGAVVLEEVGATPTYKS